MPAQKSREQFRKSMGIGWSSEVESICFNMFIYETLRVKERDRQSWTI